MKPKVSIIVPVYNVEKYLARCLDSLVNQTLDDIEIIVVNDGTKDNSQLIIDQYVKNYPNKVYSFIKENGGLGDARNFGMKHAKADYIGFVDSDDYVENRMYELLYNKAVLEEADLVLCDLEYEWEDSSKRLLLKGLKQVVNTPTSKSVFLSPLFAWNKLYKRSLFTEHEILYPKSLWYEDIPVSLPLFSLIKNISYVDKVLIHYIQRNSSIMGTSSSPKLYDIFDVLNLVLRFYQDNNFFQKFKNELEYIFVEQLMLYGSFRFYRSDACNELMELAFKQMNDNFPHWKSNPYIKTLPKKYQVYLKLLSKYTMPVLKMYVIKRA